MRLTIPDDLADQILEQMPPRADFDQIITRLLTKALPLLQEGGVAVGRDDVERLAQITLKPSIGSAKDLVTAARELHELKIGRHRLELPPVVLKGLRERAVREGKDFSEVLAQAVQRIGQELEQCV